MVEEYAIVEVRFLEGSVPADLRGTAQAPLLPSFSFRNHAPTETVRMSVILRQVLCHHNRRIDSIVRCWIDIFQFGSVRNELGNLKFRRVPRVACEKHQANT